MFDLYLLNLPPLNLYNVNLLLTETNYERAIKSPLFVSGECKGKVVREDVVGRIEGLIARR